MRFCRVLAVFSSVILVTVGLIFVQPASAEVVAPALTVPVNATVPPNEATAITPITLDDGGSPSVQVQLSVTNGTLSMSTTTGLTFVGSAANGTANVSFSANSADAQAALSTLSFTPTAAYIGAATLTYVTLPAGAVFNPDNGHFYRVYSDDPDTWTNAESAAAISTYQGRQGYLATITSAEEQAFIEPLLGSGRTWIGGSDADSDNTWKWVSGPEAGTTFFEGLYDYWGDGVCETSPGMECGAVSGEYNHWPPYNIQPNNKLRNSEEPENYLSIDNATGYWDDFADVGNVQSLGYVGKRLYEYGGMVGDINDPVVDTQTTSIAVQASAPGQPTGVNFERGNGQITVNWLAPSSDGGDAIDYYMLEYSTDGGDNWNQRPTTALLTDTVTGLQNGTPVYFRVSAHNGSGFGPTSTPLDSTPATTPGAPTDLQATVADAETTVSWGAAPDNGDDVLGYKVEYSSNGGNDWAEHSASTDSPTTILELNNGTEYTIRVTPMNLFGDGTPATKTVTPGTAPGSIANLTLTPGDQQLQVDWDAPVSDGGYEIDYYLVEYSYDGNDWIARPHVTNGTQDTISALSNGVEVSVRVTAHNALGLGTTAAPESQTPATTPTAPQDLQASVSNEQSVVTWTTPLDNGGATITGYKVEYSSDGGDSYSVHSANTTSPATITNLSNGTTYTIRVTPLNAEGDGAPATVTVTPGTVPATPGGITLTAGNGQVLVDWTAPVSGGHAIDHYLVEYSINSGDTWVPTSTTSSVTKTITGLANGTAVQVRVSAHNDIGYGPSSSPQTETPATTASAPLTPQTVASDGQITVTWDGPSSTGGSAISGYKVEYSSNGGNSYTQHLASTQSPATITGLANGTLYRIRITPINGVGEGTPVTIDTVAGEVASAPVDLETSSMNSAAKITWLPPQSTGGSVITGYRVEYGIADSGNWTVATSAAESPYVIIGLTNGTTYDVRVSAINQIGAGSAGISTVTPLGAASAPQNLSVTNTANSAVVTWGGPVDDGGASVDSYTLEYRLTNGEWSTVSTNATSPSGIVGLVPGTAYELRLFAVTEYGKGTAASASFATTVPPTPGVSAPIHIDPEGTITPVPVFATPVPAPVVASTPTGLGSWALTPDGGIFTAGDAPFLGSMGGTALAAPAVGIAPTTTGEGYYIVGSDGGVFSFGDAQFQGSMGGVALNAPVTGLAPSCDSAGYYLVANDGGVFAFGAVGFFGSMAGLPLNQGMIGIVDACGKNGYWTFANDGGVFTFGDAQFYGSLGSNPPQGGIIGMVSAPDGLGYWLIGADNQAYGFGSVAD